MNNKGEFVGFNDIHFGALDKNGEFYPIKIGRTTHYTSLENILKDENLGKTFVFDGSKKDFEHTIVKSNGYITYITSSYTVANKILLVKAKRMGVEFYCEG